MGAGIGLYDGVFGPGTGTFLVFGLVALLGYSFLNASAIAKVVNVATNLAALIVFAAAGTCSGPSASPWASANLVGRRDRRAHRGAPRLAASSASCSSSSSPCCWCKLGYDVLTG